MPICQKCNNKFKQYIIVNGKIRNFQRRKYCIKCSPFGHHNTTQIHKEQNSQIKLLTCKICKREYEYNKKRRLGHTLNKCNSCVTSEKRYNIKKKCVEYKGGKCIICGYNKCIEALEFHHINPVEKDFSVGSSYYYKWERIKVELDKCSCLCANCHREIHSDLDNLIKENGS